MSEWIVAGQWGVKTTRSNWYGQTFRQVIQASVVPVSGTKVRITFKAPASGVLDILDCFVGLCEGDNPAGAAFKSPPVRVKVSGSNSFTIPANGTVISDEVELIYDRENGDALMVSFAVTEQRFHANTGGQKSATGVTLHYIAGNHADSMPDELGNDIFRFDPTFSTLAVARIEIFSEDVPAGPVTRNLPSSYDISNSGGGWEVIDEWVIDGILNISRGYTFRLRVDSSVLAPVSKVRLVAKGHPTVSMEIANVVIAEGSSNAAKDHGYLYPPIPVTWNGGSSGFTLAPNQELVSDPVSIVYNPASGRPLVIGTWIDPSAPTSESPTSLVHLGGSVFRTFGNDLTNQSPTGYSELSLSGWLYLRIDGEILDQDEVDASKLSLYAITGVAHEVALSKLSLYTISGRANSTDVSKLSLYAVTDTRFESRASFDYAILSDQIASSMKSDYSIQAGDFISSLHSDFRILGIFQSLASFDYRVEGPFIKEARFDYRIYDNAFQTEMSFDFRVLEFMSSQIGFDYRLLQSGDISASTRFGYLIEDQPMVDLPAIELFPMEPVREGWAWKTLVNISHSGKEQRIALRQRPRIMISYSAGIPDEEYRISAYNQLYSSIGKTPKIPFFQYATALTAPLVAGDTGLKFDPNKTYVQSGTPICLYRPRYRQYVYAQVGQMTPTGAILEEPFSFNLGTDWEVMPVYYMRLPDLTSIDMEALTGEYTLAGEQAYRRAFLRQEATVSVPMFEGKPLLAIRPIAVNNVTEQFDSNAEVLDNGTGLPKPYSSYENPFVDGVLEWLIDRETDMDFWRALLNLLRGQQSTFYMSTWREDLTPVENNVGHVIVSELDYAEKFQHNTYRYLQFEMPSGVYHRTVISVSPVAEGLSLVLSSSIPDEEIETISYLNLVRLNDDIVYLDHYRHHSTISLPIRTVNE